ncbi:MAG TPA: 4a-hydroxytetrahydrobiopterin dehydratase [Candidatus Acidoferrales bacterium]|nr:4a-hydroxytetrahydrobiopterin dehydratase [Candidatus Acidoferrales bacterium]
MRVLKLAWLGTRSTAAAETADFFARVLGLQLEQSRNDLWVFKLPDGSAVEVFGPANPDNRHFSGGPVIGFLVDDLESAVAELRQAEVEIVFGPRSSPDGSAWVHFRGPDGNLYELTRAAGVSRSDLYQPVTPEAAYQSLAGHPAWVIEPSRIYRDLRFDSFSSALGFVNRVAGLAERVGHHPNIRIHEWCFVQLKLYSHLTGGITQKDVEFALALDEMLAGEAQKEP